MNRFQWAGLALACVVLGIAGCQSKQAPSGDVQFPDGSPLMYGQVVFESETAKAGGACDIKTDGSFDILEPLPTGEYVVYVTDARKPINAGAGTFGPTLVQDQYTRPGTSPLRAKVGDGLIHLVVEPAGK